MIEAVILFTLKFIAIGSGMSGLVFAKRALFPDYRRGDED